MHAMYQTSHDNDQMTSLSFVIAPLDVADDNVPLVNKATALDNIRYTKSAIVHQGPTIELLRGRGGG